MNTVRPKVGKEERDIEHCVSLEHGSLVADDG